MKNIRFYFDFISPYSYLAVTQIPAWLEAIPARLSCVPVLFAGLLNAHGQKGPAEIPAKRRSTFIDCLRWARYYEVPLLGPPTHPFNPLASLRMATALSDPEPRWAWVRRVMSACWAEEKDISNPGTLLALAGELGLEAKPLWEQAQSPEIKEALKKNTQEAADRGIFGVPTFEVEGELFWGNDRMEFLKLFLQGRLPPTDETVENILGRPSSAQR